MTTHKFPITDLRILIYISIQRICLSKACVHNFYYIHRFISANLGTMQSYKKYQNYVSIQSSNPYFLLSNSNSEFLIYMILYIIQEYYFKKNIRFSLKNRETGLVNGDVAISKYHICILSTTIDHRYIFQRLGIIETNSIANFQVNRMRKNQHGTIHFK